MTNSNSGKVSGWRKIEKWYADHAYAVNIVYSAGASVVIIGALFKILHWPGASYVLMIGMFTEAFLFMLGIFERPHVVYNWENLFPDLIGHKESHMNLGSIAQQGALPEKEMEQLREGISNLGKAAGQLAELGKVVPATEKLNAELVAASEAAHNFATTQSGLSVSAIELEKSYQGIATEMTKTVESVKAYEVNMEKANAQLTKLNALHELQLKEAQTVAEAAKKHTATAEALVKGAEALKASQLAADEASKQYAAAQAELAKKVADLNKVYGNMLNAL